VRDSILRLQVLGSVLSQVSLWLDSDSSRDSRADIHSRVLFQDVLSNALRH